MTMPGALIPQSAGAAPVQDPVRPGRSAGQAISPRRWSRVPRLAAALAVLAGLINLGSALLPAERDRLRLLAHLAPGVVSRGATVAPTAAVGFTSDSECLNAVGGPQFETYLTRDVVGWVDRRYRTVRQAGGRVVGGMSSGGYCALNLGLRHQDEFSVILAHEPYGTPGTSARWRLLGGSQARYQANSPIAYLPTMPFRHRLAVFLDAPASDPGSLSDTLRVAHELAARDQLVSLQIVHGVGHTWQEARRELPYSLVFASRHLTAAGPRR